MNLFSKIFLDEKIKEAVDILFQASKDNAVLSFSGGVDSVVINALIKMYQIPINTIFFNKEVENNFNRQIIKKVAKTYKNIIDIKTESYSSIVNRLGFPIKNKNFSQLCYEIRKPVSHKNVILAFKRVTGVSPFKLKVLNSSNAYSLELKYWYLARNYPIQERCCNILKKAPSKKIGRNVIVGIMKNDSPARRRAIESNFHGKYFPLQNWTKSDVFEFIERFKIEYSKAYQDRKINDDITVIGTTNTGCLECHFGQNVNYYFKKNGKIFKSSKFEIMKIERPKAYKKMMSRTHAPTGITYKETIECFNKSKNGEFIKESIIERNKYIEDILRFGKDVLGDEAKKFIKSFYIEENLEDKSNKYK